MKEILYFTADWCYPCIETERVIKELLDKHPEVMYTRVDVDNNIEKTIHYEVKSVPSIFVLYDSFIHNNINGQVSYIDLENLIK